ncbi:MAG: two-component system response regulator [Magnetococcales bacterium]|nr:two-component system response regulator [Magnetococcales bacterium]HIJ83606.1 two-component system response regulator [Magnetococcales bacterium]
MNTPIEGQESKKTILIVDDVPDNLYVLQRMLSSHYRVQIATNGRIAIKIALSPTQPDLILLDVMMPELDGYETCRLLKQQERTRDIPILFVTARSEAEDETRGFELGAADYLVKPVSPPVVLARVRTHLSMRDQRKLLADQVALRTAQLQVRNMELEETRMEVIRQLGRASEYRDNETGLHVVRMSRYVHLLALRSGLSEPEADQLMQAAPMHDLGKIGIPDHILLKPGKLTSEEFDIIKTHAEIGYEIIGPQKSDLLNMGRVIALTHHEKWNGTGYPKRIAGEVIPLAGRLVAIGDVFDALTSSRPYKKAWTLDDALGLLAKESGEHFDPRLAQIFSGLRDDLAKIMEKYQDGHVIYSVSTGSPSNPA